MAKKPKTGATRSTQPLGDGIQSLSGDGVAAVPAITSPLTGGYVPAATNLFVTITTNRTDLPYVLELEDLTMGGTVSIPITAPGGSPFTVKIDGANLVANRHYKITIAVDPSEPRPPNHQEDSVTVTTEEPLLLFTMDAPKKAVKKK